MIGLPRLERPPVTPFGITAPTDVLGRPLSGSPKAQAKQARAALLERNRRVVAAVAATEAELQARGIFVHRPVAAGALIGPGRKR